MIAVSCYNITDLTTNLSIRAIPTAHMIFMMLEHHTFTVRCVEEAKIPILTPLSLQIPCQLSV